MSVLRRGSLPGSNSWRRWWIAAIALVRVVTALIIRGRRPRPQRPGLHRVDDAIPQSPANGSPDAGTNSDGGS
jgi:hypothetical protein